MKAEIPPDIDAPIVAELSNSDEPLQERTFLELGYLGLEAPAVVGNAIELVEVDIVTAAYDNAARDSAFVYPRS